MHYLDMENFHEINKYFTLALLKLEIINYPGMILILKRIIFPELYEKLVLS